MRRRGDKERAKWDLRIKRLYEDQLKKINNHIFEIEKMLIQIQVRIIRNGLVRAPLVPSALTLPVRSPALVSPPPTPVPPPTHSQDARQQVDTFHVLRQGQRIIRDIQKAIDLSEIESYRATEDENRAWFDEIEAALYADARAVTGADAAELEAELDELCARMEEEAGRLEERPSRAAAATTTLELPDVPTHAPRAAAREDAATTTHELPDVPTHAPRAAAREDTAAAAADDSEGRVLLAA